jgi:hypothetical protein
MLSATLGRTHLGGSGCPPCQQGTLVVSYDVTGLERRLIRLAPNPLGEIAVLALIHDPFRALYDGPLVSLLAVLKVYVRWLPFALACYLCSRA